MGERTAGSSALGCVRHSEQELRVTSQTCLEHTHGPSRAASKMPRRQPTWLGLGLGLGLRLRLGLVLGLGLGLGLRTTARQPAHRDVGAVRVKGGVEAVTSRASEDHVLLGLGIGIGLGLGIGIGLVIGRGLGIDIGIRTRIGC